MIGQAFEVMLAVIGAGFLLGLLFGIPVFMVALALRLVEGLRG